MSVVGVVAIGRNEGERLRRCLESLAGLGLAVVYVDSGSKDDSPGLARGLGADVVELDRSSPFSAARARNEGFDRLLRVAPGVEFVQFVDGDCEIAGGWIGRARDTLAGRPDVGVVCGRRRERFPEHSIYNRLADLEWGRPVGELDSCGGDAMVRAAAFREAGGYNPTLPAGEEPELCQRVRRKGWKVWGVDADMTWHDLDMRRFGAWWKRQVRSGYSGLDVARRFSPGRDGLFRDQVRSARLWAGFLPAAVAAGGAAGALAAGPTGAAAAAAVLALPVPAQVVRLAWRVRRDLPTARDALAFGALTMVAKWGHLAGQLLYARDRVSGRHARLIEYKGGGPPRRAQAAPGS